MKSLINILITLELLLVILIFGFLHHNKFGHILPNNIYLALLLIYLSYSLIVSIYSKKYLAALTLPFQNFVKLTIWTALLTLFFTTSTIVLTELKEIARLFILALAFIPTIVELTIFSIIRFIFLKDKFQTIEKHASSKRQPSSKVSINFITIGAVLLICNYFLLIKVKTGGFHLYPWSERIILLLFATWLISLILTRKYVINTSTNIYYTITPFIKSGIIMFLLSAFIFYFFRAELISRFLLFGTILTYSSIEIFIHYLYFYLSKGKSTSINNLEPTENSKSDLLSNVQLISNDKNIELDNLNEDIKITSAIAQISSLSNKKDIIAFLQDKINNLRIKQSSHTILSTVSIENIEILKNASKSIIINLHKVNDIQRLNQYLLLCRDKIITGGFLVGFLLPLETIYTRLRNKMPKLIFTILYPIHFLIYRVMPKIPKIKRLYFMISRGKNRSISKYELYGRLNYCGFSIVNEKIINNEIYFIARNNKTISKEQNPSYHPIIKLKRIGLNAKFIYIYKFRTMYPYSEFLQDYAYQRNELTESGNKFNNDLRITKWGKYLRKYWIDELPQIFNWLRGDLNLIGVRALSEQYFNLYPKDHQEFRSKFKPGLIPPFYADLPISFNDKILSERKYLEQQSVAPFKTNIKYSLLTMYNIIFKGIRSE